MGSGAAVGHYVRGRRCRSRGSLHAGCCVYISEGGGASGKGQVRCTMIRVAGGGWGGGGGGAQAEIGAEGGLQLLVKVLEAYVANEGLMENCCFATANLSFNNEVLSVCFHCLCFAAR